MPIDNSSTNFSQGEPTGKKPYEKPSFRYERVFVTTALSCGKFNPISEACRGNPKSS